jgi:hypothetical protein
VKTNRPTKGINPEGYAWMDVVSRGKNYHLVEISGEDFEDILKKATTADGERIDTQLQYKLMLLASCKEPALTTRDVAKMGYRQLRQLLSATVELHFADEEPEPEDEDLGKA